MSVQVQHTPWRVAALLVSLVAIALPLAADAQASTLQWRSYVGGPGTDRLTAVAQASNGDILVVGTTTSQSLNEPPAAGTNPTEDYFIARFTAAGARVWVHVYGGPSTFDRVNAIAVTPANDIYIVGSTQTSNMTNVGTVYEGSRGGEEGFLAKIAYADGFPEWFMYLSGNDVDAATGVVASSDAVYVTGYTHSTNFLGYLPRQQGGEAFVVKVNPANPGTFPWIPTPFRFIGGTALDQAFDIALDTDKLLVVGTTRSNPLSGTPSPVTPFHGDADAFVAKLDAATGATDWVTYVGGAMLDEGNAVTVHPVTHEIAVAGTTTSTDLGAPPTPGGRNAFTAWLATNGTQLRTRVLGGSSDEEAVSVSFDSQGNTYIGGTTASLDLPVTPSSALDSQMEGGTGLREGFLAAIPASGGEGWVSFFGGDLADQLTSIHVSANRLMMTLQTSSGTGFPTPIGAAYDPTLSIGPDGYIAILNLMDITPPTAGNVNDRPAPDITHADIDVQDITDRISANWNSFSHPAGIGKYEWAIGTLASPEVTQPFTSVSTSTFATHGTLSLQVGTRYYVTVRAHSPYGITATSRSDGVLITPRDGGTGTPDGGTDGGTGTPDGGTDGGTGTPDGGTGTPDGGTGTTDGGTGTTDGGTGATDGGTDAGTGTTDGGTDAGTGTTDGGTDGGAGTPDGGPSGDDAGTGGDDGGTGDKNPRSPIGWGCSSAGGAGVPLLLGLMLLALMARRSSNSAR